MVVRSFAVAVLAAGLAGAQTAPEIRAAVDRAIPPLERSDAAFLAKRACVSCHHNYLPILAFHSARNRGIAVDPAVLSTLEAKTFRSLRGPGAFEDAVRAATLNDPTPDDSFLLISAYAAGLAPNLTTAVYARRLVQWQRDGHWVTSDFRPPHSSSYFTATASAVRAIALYMPQELGAERDACIRRARQWLYRERPASTEDAAFRLLGLVWAGAPANEIAGARRDLLTLRKPDGGWGELPGYRSDAYSTGESLFALHESGVPTTDVAWRTGATFLISNQAADGTWHVATRMVSPAEVSPEYFPTGFPYEKDEYLSYAGSVWAVMAMLEGLPEAAHAPTVSKDAETEAPSWTRTALFGTASQLATLLDTGLDANGRTERAATVLMMAATDPAKVRLLLSHGAKASYEAVAIAAASRGTAGAIRALLDAGAPVQAPEGVRSKNSPLVLASMAGDAENVKLLLAHGAEPSAALAQAVTFGYADLVRMLIAAGAPAKLTESSGINLLHWATITNRPAVIPALVAAGVSLNAQDESGFTPLLYAATIDFGDTAVLRALLKAGADRNIRNKDGRTPLEQARHFGHANLEAVLR